MKRNSILFLASLILVGFIIFLHFMPTSEAIKPIIKHIEKSNEPPKIINIVLSESCQKQITYKIKTTCPTIKELLQYDTTNQNISGHFNKTSSGDLIREKPATKYHLKFYNSNVVCLTCELNYFRSDAYQTIIVTNQNFTYIDKYVNNKTNTVNVYGLRSMDGCEAATIAYSKPLMKDTISYLESDCKTTKFNNYVLKKLPSDTPSKYNSPFTSYNYKNFIDTYKHLGNCITGKCEIKPLYRNWN